MSSLPTQPYQVMDFSGGKTENFIGGGPTRYMHADNLWVTVDRKLEERYGSQILDSVNYQLPSGNSPVNSFVPHDIEAFLLGIACPNVYVLNPNWTGILGPTGNPPLSGGNYTNAVSAAEWSHHTILTNDSLASSPVKIYRGAAYPTSFLVQFPTPAPTVFPFMAVTAGLPSLKNYSQPNISNSSLLAQSLILANSLQSNMVLHMQDFGSTLDTNLHTAEDTIDIALLNAVSPAVDQASLLTLVNALVSAYTGHVSDAIFQNYTYHYQSNFKYTPPLNFLPSNTSAATTLTGAAMILDDLKTKFFMHQMSPSLHSSGINYTFLAKYLVTTPHIGSVTTGPILNPNYSQSLALANLVKTNFNAHINDLTYHFTQDTQNATLGMIANAVTFPNAVDLDSLYIMIAHLRWGYNGHYNDSLAAHNYAVGDISSGGNSLTNIKVGGITFTPFLQQTIWDGRPGTVFPQTSQIVYATAVGSGTATSSINNASSTVTAHPFDFTFARYHFATTTQQSTEELSSALNGQYSQYPPDNLDLSNWLSLLTQLISSFNAHDGNDFIHVVNAFQHQVTNVVPTISSYAFALHYFYQYMRYDGVIFQVVGPPTFLGPVLTEALGPAYTTQNTSGFGFQSIPLSSLTITNIPTLVNGGQNNYDTANVQVKIFRTINAGSTYYNAGIISNGTSSFTDSLPDVITPNYPNIIPLQLQTVIYTSGNVVNFDPAPVSKYVTVLQNTAYYGAIVDTGQTFLNRIRQSIQNNIDSSPGAFFLDLPDVLMGISNTRNNLIALCANSCHQVTGAFNQLGQGQMQSQSISDTIGCVSSKSIVRTDVGIFFAGTDGFYYTDGFQLIKLSSELNLTYAALVSNAKQRAAIYGCYDRYNRRVWWTTQPSPSDYSPTQVYIFHVNFGVTANGVFTTASNVENFRPTSMIFWQGKHIRGDARGYLFLHSNLSKTDPQVNIHTVPTSWNTAVIPYNYSSCAIDFGTTFNRKWLTRITMNGKNVGNVGAQITSVSDNGRVAPLALSPVLFKPNIMWGQPNIIWGAPNSQQPLVWGEAREMDVWRRFPATQLRADFKQIKITPAFVGVYRYQDWPVGAGAQVIPNGNGTASVKILTPPQYTSITWPLDVVGYFFSQQGDGFIANYAITALSDSKTLLVSDPNNILTADFVAWIIRGTLKQQRLSLTSYVIHFTLLGKMQSAFHGPQDAGENATGTNFSSSHILTEDGGIMLGEDGNPIDTEDQTP